mmetsp:Transcript_32757/g.62895  ORF Transcript_32757/g.62895 Transcript_32757/m.62895 type:complete len:351 (+) Transcript_32757:340-1392(+)
MGAGCTKNDRSPVVDQGFLRAVPVPIHSDSNTEEVTKEALPPYVASAPLRPLEEPIQNLPPYIATPPLSPIQEQPEVHELLIAPHEDPPSPGIESPRAPPPAPLCGDEPQSGVQMPPPLQCDLAVEPDFLCLQSPQATDFVDEEEGERGGSSDGNKNKNFAQLSSDRWEDVDSNPHQSPTPEAAIRSLPAESSQGNTSPPTAPSAFVQAEPQVEVPPTDSPTSPSKSSERSMSAPQGPELDLESAMVLDSLDLSARGSFSSADQTAEQDDLREQLATPSSIHIQEPVENQISYGNILETPEAPRSVAGDMQDQETEDNFMSINYSDADFLSVPNSRSGSRLGRFPSRDAG